MSEVVVPQPTTGLSSADQAATALQGATDQLQLTDQPLIESARKVNPPAAPVTASAATPVAPVAAPTATFTYPISAPLSKQSIIPSTSILSNDEPVVQAPNNVIAPVLKEEIYTGTKQQLAQAATGGEREPQPIDLTPVQLPERGPMFTTFSTFQTNALYRLPARMFFSCITDNSIRLETNVFQTESHNKSDLIYRVFPNVLVGYALTNKTRVAGNYFFFRDQYAVQDNTLSRNINSFGLRADHDMPLSDRTTLSAGIFGRALLTQLTGSANHTLSDVIPSLTLTRRVGYASVVYAAILGQIRFRNVFGEFQEGDQFYSVGAVWRKRPYVFWADLTLDSNFGKKQLRGGQNNQVIILTLEVARRISSRLPISVFVQTQPIFNIGADSPGLSGFNYRLFGGLRAEIAKPAIFPVKLSQK